MAQARWGEEVGCGEEEGGDERQRAGEEVCVRCEGCGEGVAGMRWGGLDVSECTCEKY